MWSLDRESDMLELLKRQPNALAFMGQDRYNEFNPTESRKFGFMPLKQIMGRFVIATTEDKVERLKDKLTKVEPLVIATSYPRMAAQVVENIRYKEWGLCWKNRYARESFEAVFFGGSVESKPSQVEEIDGIYDIVDTGDTIDANGLTIVVDDFNKITVGSVCRKPYIQTKKSMLTD